MAERPYKESRHKLTVEKGIICNGDIIILLHSLRKEVLKDVYDKCTLWYNSDTNEVKIRSMVARIFSGCRKLCKKLPKMC